MPFCVETETEIETVGDSEEIIKTDRTMSFKVIIVVVVVVIVVVIIIIIISLFFCSFCCYAFN